MPATLTLPRPASPRLPSLPGPALPYPAEFLADVTRKGELLRAGLRAALEGNPHVQVGGLGAGGRLQLHSCCLRLFCAARLPPTLASAGRPACSSSCTASSCCST